MDRAKAAFFAARQEIAGTLSKPEAADRAITELLRLLHIDFANPSPTSSSDSTALKALALVWGSNAGPGDKEISQKIDAYRKRYVAARGGDAGERADAARDFDTKVSGSLSKSLGARNRSMYEKALGQQGKRWANGNITKPEMHENMAGIARQLIADTDDIFHGAPENEHLKYFRNEVKGALGFVDNERDLMQALNYLWGAKPEQERDEAFAHFDEVVNDVVSMMVDSDDRCRKNSNASGFERGHAIGLKKREFIAESRDYLGSLLPDATKVKQYRDREASARSQYMQRGQLDYQGYKNQMLHHLASMQVAVLNSPNGSESTRLDSAVSEAVERLLASGPVAHVGSVALSVPDALAASYLDVVAHESGHRWNDFNNCRNKYVDVSVEKNQEQYKSRSTFTRAVQKALIEKLPNDIKNNFKELLGELDSLLRTDFITDSVYDYSAVKLLKKVSGEALSDENPSSAVFLQFSVAEEETNRVGGDLTGSGLLHSEVTEALKSVLELDSDPAKVLACLGYFWGVPETRLNRHKYTEFGIRRNKYMQAHGGKAVSAIPTDCEFVREAQKILVGRLPAWLQEKYKLQQDALKQFGMGGTDVAESTGHFLMSFVVKPQ